jgi:hypothetical protein
MHMLTVVLTLTNFISGISVGFELARLSKPTF